MLDRQAEVSSYAMTLPYCVGDVVISKNLEYVRPYRAYNESTDESTNWVALLRLHSSIVPRALYNSYVDHWLLLFAVYQDPTGDGYNVY